MTGQHCPECGIELGDSITDHLPDDPDRAYALMLSLYQLLGAAQAKLKTEIMAMMKAPGVAPGGNGLEAYWTRNDEHASFQGSEMVEDFHLLPDDDPSKELLAGIIEKYTRIKPRTYFNVRRTKTGAPILPNGGQ